MPAYCILSRVRIKDTVSPTLRRLLARAEWATDLPETRAKCDQCIQARGATAIYKDSLKCCTFFPSLPNFMVGAILDSDLPGRHWLQTRLRAQGDFAPDPQRVSKSEAVAVPLGIFPAIDYQRRWHARQPQGYGNDETLLCPHFISQGGRCGIWRERPSTCVSFYCESSYGLAGTEFWAKFEKYLSALELTIAQEALLRLGMTKPEIELSLKFLPRFGAPDPHGYTGAKLRAEEARAWAEFGADKPEFYRDCFAIARELDAGDVAAMMGETGAGPALEALAVLSAERR